MAHVDTANTNQSLKSLAVLVRLGKIKHNLTNKVNTRHHLCEHYRSLLGRFENLNKFVFSLASQTLLRKNRERVWSKAYTACVTAHCIVRANYIRDSGHVTCTGMSIIGLKTRAFGVAIKS